jgi:hypothetical protein
MNDAEFQKFLWLSSVPLVRLNQQFIPSGIASGCLIDYCGKRLLLTVTHATGDQQNWAIQLRYVPNKGTETLQLGAMNFLVVANLSNATLRDVDYSYVEVPSTTFGYRQEIQVQSDTVISEAPLTVHTPNLQEMPRASDTFGFCGMVMPALENHFGHKCLGGELRIYSGLSFLRTEGDYHVFLLPFGHPGHHHFQGCSGAPIFSNSGSLVALVCKGCETTSEIWGISIAQYKIPIDILAGNVR